MTISDDDKLITELSHYNAFRGMNTLEHKLHARAIHRLVDLTADLAKLRDAVLPVQEALEAVSNNAVCHPKYASGEYVINRKTVKLCEEALQKIREGGGK